MQFQTFFLLFWSLIDLAPAVLHSPAPVWISWLLGLVHGCLFWNFPLPLFSAEFSVSLILYTPVSWFTVFIFRKHILLYLSMSLCPGGKIFESLNVWTFLSFCISCLAILGLHGCIAALVFSLQQAGATLSLWFTGPRACRFQ